MAETSGLNAVGFIGDIIGNDARLRSYLPVVERLGEYFVPIRDPWDLKALERLPRHDAGELRKAHERQDLAGITFNGPINPTLAELPLWEGDLVWFAGTQFVTNCTMLANPAVSESIEIWPQEMRTAGRLRVGDATEFRDYTGRLYAEAKVGMHRALYGSPQPRWSVADVRFAILDNLDVGDVRDQDVNRGLYFLEQGDSDRYEMTAFDAVDDGYFRSVRAFRRAVEGLRHRLQTQGSRRRSIRAERHVQRPPAPVHPGVVRGRVGIAGEKSFAPAPPFQVGETHRASWALYQPVSVTSVGHGGGG